jgi:signal transduction histidine kinase
VITHPALTGRDTRLDQLRRLSEINRALTYTASIDTVARLTVEGAAELLEAASAVLMLQDAEGLLHVRGASGIPEDKVARFRAPLTDEVIGRIQGLLDVREDCFLAVPLVVDGGVTGLIAVGRAEPATASDEWLLSALADQAALGLENARLGGEVRLEMEGRLRASEGATNAKDRALATLAHDIRTPLGAIEGYCTILEDGLYGPITAPQREAIERMRMSGRHLLSLLDNVMDMARLSAGKASVRAEPVRLLDVAREATAMLTPAAKTRSQRLTVAGEDLLVSADASRVRQILVNLIGNAVKFTPAEGTIAVSVVAASESDRSWAIVNVTDSGPGIDAGEQAAIFEAYYRSEGSATLPGIGLGLAISAGLTAQMGGELRVASEPGQGATFSLRFPVLVPAGRSEIASRGVEAGSRAG